MAALLHCLWFGRVSGLLGELLGRVALGRGYGCWCWCWAIESVSAAVVEERRMWHLRGVIDSKLVEVGWCEDSLDAAARSRSNGVRIEHGDLKTQRAAVCVVRSASIACRTNTANKKGLLVHLPRTTFLC